MDLQGGGVKHSLGLIAKGFRFWDTIIISVISMVIFSKIMPTIAPGGFSMSRLVPLLLTTSVNASRRQNWLLFLWGDWLDVYSSGLSPMRRITQYGIVFICLVQSSDERACVSRQTGVSEIEILRTDLMYRKIRYYLLSSVTSDVRCGVLCRKVKDIVKYTPVTFVKRIMN